MDPISAVGFAASIITFIDFGYKVVTGTLEVLKTGSLSENTHISLVINDFHAVVRPLAQLPAGKSEHEMALRELGVKCRELSQELVDLLEWLKTNPNGSSWKSVRLALRSMRKRGEIHELEEQLSKYRSEIMTRLAFILNERQVAIQVQLSDFQSQVVKRSSDAAELLERLRNDVLEAVENTLRQVPPADAGAGDDIGDQLQLLRAIRDSLDGLLQGRTGPSPEMRILRQLHFGSLHRREDDMAPAGVDTFEWMLAGRSVGSLNQEEGKGPDEKKKHEASRREAAAARFLHWLREENGVFHISGKPGSGKSTMMKLLLRDRGTKQALEQWAGPNRLVFAHFFFWLSGERLQYSLEGLHRSILFETLIQCPELIPHVFPRAYRSFSKASADESIDEVFFRPSDIQKAFIDLMTRSPQTGYRFCLFIDGLDEYGGDDVGDWEHQQLADTLNAWAAHPDVKILASSRPHRQFEDTFSDERRIRLHELTRSDIVLAGRQMFEKDKSFERPEVKECYGDLVEKVADASDGVFLWAGLAIRSLLNAVGRFDRIDSLKQHLNGIPRNVNKLYEKMFMSIDPVDQARAFKLLLFMAEIPFYFGHMPNALIVTWLEDLDDPDFPMKCGFRPYTDEEVRQRQLEAKYQVDGLTRGLLEVVDITGAHLFHRKSVQFFHRTVRDFVRQSSILQGFATKFPDPIDIWTRLHLAELYFGRNDDVRVHGSIAIEYFRADAGLVPDDRLLDAYWEAFEHHNDASRESPRFRGRVTTLNTLPGILQDLEGTSPLQFLPFLARVGFVGYIQRKVAADPGWLRPQGPISLLLTAAVSRGPSAMVKVLLDAGASPHDLVSTFDSNSRFTVWQLACTGLLVHMLHPPTREQLLRRNCEVIQYFLEAGADPECFLLLAPISQAEGEADSDTESQADSREGSDVDSQEGSGVDNQEGNQSESDEVSGTGSAVPPRPTHAISMRTLLRQFDPPNLGELLKLMGEPKPSPDYLGVVFSAWEYLTGKKAKPTFRLEDYAPWDLAMDPYQLPGSYFRRLFFLHSVVFGDTRVDPLVKIKWY